MTANLYETLGVGRAAAAHEIKSAFRKAAKRAHPDAGGNADEFSRLNRAYLVLVDPDRRAEYDRTGKVDEHADNSHLAALQVLHQMMDEIIEQVGERICVDVVAEMRRAMDAKLAQIAREITTCRRKVVRLARFASKFRKEAGENVLRKMVEAKIAGAERGIESAEKAIADITKARALLDGYSFEPDPDERPMMWATNTFSTTAAA